LQAKQGPASAKHLALLSVGEIGRTTDLSCFSTLQKALTTSLASKSDELKGAASLALGAVAVGNLQAYFPFILHQIQEQVRFLQACIPGEGGGGSIFHNPQHFLIRCFKED